MSENNGGPAFPASYPCGPSGMTLRDYFAAKAMAAFMSGDWTFVDKDNLPDKIATDAYTMADAMLAAREAK